MALRPFIKTIYLPCFPSRNITKNAETRKPPMRDIIVEQPLKGHLRTRRAPQRHSKSTLMAI